MISFFFFSLSLQFFPSFDGARDRVQVVEYDGFKFVHRGRSREDVSYSRIFITKIIFGLGNIYVCIVSMYLLFRNSRRTRRRIEIELSLEGGGIFYPGKQKVRLVEVVR